MRAISSTPGGSRAGSTHENVEAVRLNISPTFEQVGNFPLWGEFVANAVWVDLLKLCGVLGGEDDIAWVNRLPDESCFIWPLWPIDKPRGQPGIARQQGSSFQDVFGRFIFQVGIHHLKQLGNSLCFRFSEIQKHDGLVVSMVNGCVYYCVIVFVAS